VPLVSVLLAVHNDARYIHYAVESVLHQTVDDLELVVIDDASSDETPAVLTGFSDPRILRLRNEEQLGLAASLNRGLEVAQGSYLARLDSDDVALPEWLERLLARIRSTPPTGIVGTGIVEVDTDDRPGPVHVLPRDAVALRWHALFSAPFFHSTILLDRQVLVAYGLRYDSSFAESEDYDLWARLLEVADGANLPEPLVLRRMHPRQAQARRGDVQRAFQRDVALREIARVAPALGEIESDLAWRIGAGLQVPEEAVTAAAAAYRRLLTDFERANGADPAVRDVAARALARRGLVLGALALRPTAPARLLGERIKRPLTTRRARRRAARWLAALGPDSLRVVVVSPEPTPYRAPLFDLIAQQPELDLTVVYAARSVAGRSWHVDLHHPAVFLEGLRLPGLKRVLRHEYPVTPRIGRELRQARPDVVVVSGWSTFPAQRAIAWARARRIPYVLLVESHDVGPRAGWRRAIKGTVVPGLLRGAAGVLAVGTAARESVVARGTRPERVRIFANTIDVERWSHRVEQLSGKHDDEDLVVLSVARLAPEKGLDVLVRAIAETGDDRIRLVLAGDGPERLRLLELAKQLDVRLSMRGNLTEEELAAQYATSDVFALLSLHEPWGVVVNEAAASGLPLVLSDRVGAAYDLLREGENGYLVPAGDVHASAAALRRLADNPTFRESAGTRSRELVSGWGYEPSVKSFVAAVREATAS
jgi:glycosyltransferase involved in cell wall biosynthesis